MWVSYNVANFKHVAFQMTGRVFGWLFESSILVDCKVV